MWTLHHHNIIRLHEVISANPHRFSYLGTRGCTRCFPHALMRPPICPHPTVLEYADAGPIMQWSHEHRAFEVPSAPGGRLPERVVRQVIGDVAHALVYCTCVVDVVCAAHVLRAPSRPCGRSCRVRRRDQCTGMASSTGISSPTTSTPCLMVCASSATSVSPTSSTTQHVPRACMVNQRAPLRSTHRSTAAKVCNLSPACVAACASSHVPCACTQTPAAMMRVIVAWLSVLALGLAPVLVPVPVAGLLPACRAPS